MAVSCKRVGCRTPASTTLIIDARAATVTLVDIEQAPTGVTLCAVHIAAVTAPMNWTLVDGRDANLRLLAVDPVPSPAAIAAGGAGRGDGAARHGEPGPGPAGPEPASIGTDTGAEPASIGTDTGAEPASIGTDTGAQSGDELVGHDLPAAGAQEPFPWVHHFTAEDAPKTLNASSPLLSRAFRAAV